MGMTLLYAQWSYSISTFNTGARLEYHMVSTDHILFLFMISFIHILVKPVDTYSNLCL